MRNFRRALREARHYWFPLSVGIACSFVMATLWGVNIAALFPVIETTVHGESLQSWNDSRMVAARQHVQRLEAELAELERQPAATENEAAPALTAKKISLTTELHSEVISLQFQERLQAWLVEWLPSQPFPTVAFILVVIVLGTIVKQMFGMANSVLISYVSQSIAREIRLQIFSKALTLDRQAFNTLGASGFTACITHNTEGLAQGITAFYGGAISEPLRIISCLSMAFLVSWRVTLVSLISAPLMSMLMINVNRRMRRLASAALTRSMGFHHIMLEVFTALGTVQANTMEGFERDRFGFATKEMRRLGLWGSFYNTLANPITEVFGMAALCTGLGATAYLVITQESHILGIRMTWHPMTFAELTVIFGLLVGATDPLRKLSAVITAVNNGSAAADTIYPILDKQSLIRDPAEPKSVATPHRTLEFRNVSFSYDGHHQALDDVTLTIPFGERLAIIGPNGGGKSTLMNLLCRFFDPQRGAVLMDGVPINEMTVRDLRGRIAIVSQQFDFFDETILHNIRYGRWDATDAEVIEAAKKAKAHDFISHFAEGYQTIVGPNGQRLSGGQRQRIALARAILRDVEILILDEATSQIDVESEHLIHEALDEHCQGRTLIMITHRQSALVLATRVVEVDRGKLIEHRRPAAKAA